MDSTNLQKVPSADRPLLVGLLVDVSGSMISAMQSSSETSQNRLESFNQSFEELVTRAQSISQKGVAGAIAPLVRIFAYGFGFGNPFSVLIGDKDPNVRDLLALPGEPTSTIAVDQLAKDWSRYQEHLKQQVLKMFGDTPMVEGLQTSRERIRAEARSGNHTDPPILFVLSDGEPTDGSPSEVVGTAEDIKDDGTLIISCYITDEDITDPRRLYGTSAPDWPPGAQLMFECASLLPENSPFAGYLKEYRWTVDSQARLFTQINQSEILSEFLGVVLSPLQDEQRDVTAREAIGVTRQIEANEPARVGETSKRPQQTNIPIRVFVSYSHQDEQYVKEDSLLGYLRKGLARDGFQVWHDEGIVASQLWDERIRDEIKQADIALCLVSHDFLYSPYGQDVEITNFLKLRQEIGLRILPIILSPCDWESHEWLASTQFLPPRGKTIETHYKDRGKRLALYLDILRTLRKIGGDIRAERVDEASKALGDVLDELE